MYLLQILKYEILLAVSKFRENILVIHKGEGEKNTHTGEGEEWTEQTI